MLSKRWRELNRNRCRATSLAIRCRAGPARAAWLPPANPATTNPDAVKTGTNPAAGTKPVDEEARRAAAGGHRDDPVLLVDRLDDRGHLHQVHHRPGGLDHGRLRGGLLRVCRHRYREPERDRAQSL